MAKQKTTLTIMQLLNRIDRDLLTAAGFLETRGFDAHAAQLDGAGGHVEGVRDALEGLAEAV
jgi:hypothetical protein